MNIDIHEKIQSNRGEFGYIDINLILITDGVCTRSFHCIEAFFIKKLDFNKGLCSHYLHSL